MKKESELTTTTIIITALFPISMFIYMFYTSLDQKDEPCYTLCRLKERDIRGVVKKVFFEGGGKKLMGLEIEYDRDSMFVLSCITNGNDENIQIGDSVYKPMGEFSFEVYQDTVKKLVREQIFCECSDYE